MKSTIALVLLLVAASQARTLQKDGLSDLSSCIAEHFHDFVEQECASPATLSCSEKAADAMNVVSNICFAPWLKTKTGDRSTSLASVLACIAKCEWDIATGESNNLLCPMTCLN